jgi:hypothetical protein
MKFKNIGKFQAGGPVPPQAAPAPQGGGDPAQ